jgi:hypothetical protein
MSQADYKYRANTKLRILVDLIRHISNTNDNDKVINIKDLSFLGREKLHDDSWYTNEKINFFRCEEGDEKCLEQKHKINNGLFKDELKFTVDHNEITTDLGEYFRVDNKIVLYLNGHESGEGLGDLERIYQTIQHEYIHAIGEAFANIKIGDYDAEPNERGGLESIEHDDLASFFEREIDQVVDKNVLLDFNLFKEVAKERDVFTKETQEDDIRLRLYHKSIINRLNSGHIYLDLATLKMKINNGELNYDDFCNLRGYDIWKTNLERLSLILKCTPEAKRIFTEEIASIITRPELSDELSA